MCVYIYIYIGIYIIVYACIQTCMCICNIYIYNSPLPLIPFPTDALACHTNKLAPPI